MVDEFIYQFQSFAQYRGKLAQKSPHELELLKKCDGVWDLQGVLHYLQGLIDKSNILRELSSDGETACIRTSAQTQLACHRVVHHRVRQVLHCSHCLACECDMLTESELR